MRYAGHLDDVFSIARAGCAAPCLPSEITTEKMYTAVFQALQEADMFRMMLRALPCTTFFKDLSLCYQIANTTYPELASEIGYSCIVGKTDHDIYADQEQAFALVKEDMEILRSRKGKRYVSKKGTAESPAYFDVVKEPVMDDDGHVIGIAGIIVDITREKLYENAYRTIARRDFLTGAYNRNYFEQQKHQIPALDFPVAVIMGDANGLKAVNDVCGHAKGDLMLKMTYKAFKDSVKDRGLIYRIGGDEFVALCPRATEETCREIVESIQNQCHAAFQKGKPLSIALGFGVAQSPEMMTASLDAAEKTVYLEKKKNRSLYQRRIIEYILEHSMDKDQIDVFCMDCLCNYFRKVTKIMNYTEEKTNEVIANLRNKDVKELVFEEEFFPILMNSLREYQLRLGKLCSEDDEDKSLETFEIDFFSNFL
jgi:diguanylate cyclase (GGDEF)-like protein